MFNYKCFHATLVEKRERKVKVFAKSEDEAVERLAELYNNNSIITDVADVVDSEFINIEEVREERFDI